MHVTGWDWLPEKLFKAHDEEEPKPHPNPSPATEAGELEAGELEAEAGVHTGENEPPPEEGTAKIFRHSCQQFPRMGMLFSARVLLFCGALSRWLVLVMELLSLSLLSLFGDVRLVKCGLFCKRCCGGLGGLPVLVHTSFPTGNVFGVDAICTQEASSTTRRPLEWRSRLDIETS